MAIELRGLTPLLQVYDMPRATRVYRDMGLAEAWGGGIDAQYGIRG